MPEDEHCPHCDTAAGSVSYSLAPTQQACVNGDCPIVSWRSDRV